MGSPVILYDNRFLDGIPEATDTAVGYAAAHVRDWRQFTAWRAAAAGTKYLSVDASGAPAAKMKTNLVPYSQDLTNWLKYPAAEDVDVTADGALAPDGTMTADVVEDVSADNAGGIYKTLEIESDGTHIFSWYVQQNTSRYATFWAALQGDGGWVSANVGIDLLTGQTVSDGIAEAYGAIDCGDGYWRVYVVISAETAGPTMLAQWFCYPAAGSLTATPAASATGSVNLWGAQLGTGAELSAYIPTLDAAVTAPFADHLALTKHNLGTAAAAVSVETSPDGSTWTERLAAFTPSDDRSILKALDFPVGSPHWRIKTVTASIAAQIAVAAVGKAITFPYPPDGPFIPSDEGIEAEASTSKTGQFLGATFRFTPYAIRPSWSNDAITRVFHEGYLDPWWYDHARYLRPYFWAWDLENYPNDVRFARVAKGYRYKPSFLRAGYVDSFEIEMEGVRE